MIMPLNFSRNNGIKKAPQLNVTPYFMTKRQKIISDSPSKLLPRLYYLGILEYMYIVPLKLNQELQNYFLYLVLMALIMQEMLTSTFMSGKPLEKQLLSIPKEVS